MLPDHHGDVVGTMRDCLESEIRGRRGEAAVECIVPDHYRLRPSLRTQSIEINDNHLNGLSVKTASESRDISRPSRGRTGGSENRGPARIRSSRLRPEEGASGLGDASSISTNVLENQNLGSRLSMRNQADGASQDRDSSESASVPAVEFSAPSGSGLEGVTDVALVMANAMSRLVDERPELRSELEAMQRQRAAQAAVPAATPNDGPRNGGNHLRSSRDDRYRDDEYDDEHRRRRRRRRKGGRRHDWSAGTVITQKSSAPTSEGLLDRVANVLGDAGSRSLHIRQVAEHLASQGVMGGEISEIERATTAALVSDALRHGNASRFVLRGDARYQLRGARLPEPVAIAEGTMRKAARVLERETGEHLVRWLESLGARALEAVVRIFCEREQFPILSSLPASRGMTRMVIEDPEGEEGSTHTLVFVIPRRANFDHRQIESEIDKSGCPAVMAFIMGDIPDAAWIDDSKVISARQLAAWMLEHGIAVEKVTYTASVLDPAVIESIAGLDT
jgi:hypothetical protein